MSSGLAAAQASGVSFVVPVRNGAAFVRETFQSIFAQADGRPMEVIAVDDRSTDESAEILRQTSAMWPIRIIAAGDTASPAQRRGRFVTTSMRP